MAQMPQIEWDFKHLPSNNDQVTLLTEIVIDDKEMMIVNNHSTGKVVFVWNDSYGVIVAPQ